VTAYFLDTITAVKPYPQEIGTAWVQSIDAAATAEGRLVEDPTNHLEHNPYIPLIPSEAVPSPGR
jgi:hypothetical protein